MIGYCLWLFVFMVPVLKGWTVKVVNFSDERIMLDIKSSQALSLKRSCSFKNQSVEPHSWKDFRYKDVHPVCVGSCTQAVHLITPVRLTKKNPLTSCSDVVVIVRKSVSGDWSMTYHDWSDDMMKVLDERTRMPKSVRDLYDRFGSSEIRSLKIFRQEIMAGVRELTKIIVKDELKTLNYDEIYHTGFIIECDGVFIRLERNETVRGEVLQVPLENDVQNISVLLPRVITCGEFLTQAMLRDEHFWKYNPVSRNCQQFVLQCLEKNQIPVSDELRAFVYQDAEKILENSPFLRKFAQGVTSLANRIDNIITGGAKGPTEIDLVLENGELRPLHAHAQ